MIAKDFHSDSQIGVGADDSEGLSLGASLGESLGLSLGASLGADDSEGLSLGASLGESLGLSLGASLGADDSEGLSLGAELAIGADDSEGASLGADDDSEGLSLGASLGESLGSSLGALLVFDDFASAFDAFATEGPPVFLPAFATWGLLLPLLVVPACVYSIPSMDMEPSRNPISSAAISNANDIDRLSALVTAAMMDAMATTMSLMM